MTDDPVLPELDARAASAATALRTHVAEFDLELEPPHRSGHRGWLAAAAVLLVVALVAGAAWLAGGDQGDDLETVDRPGPLYLFPDHVPDGVRFAGATDLSATSPGDVQLLGPADVYSDDDVEDVLFTWTPGPGDGQTMAPGGTPIEVHGRKGRQYNRAGFRSVSFPAPNGQLVVVGGRGEAADDLLPVAEAATVDGAQVRLPADAVPDGLERLGSVPLDRLALADLYLGFSSSAAADGRAIAWTNDDEEDLRAVVVVVQDATAADEAVLGLFDRDVQHRQVGGHDAVTSRSTQEEVDGRAVAWIEDGHLVRVVTTGFPEDVGIAVAESLREVGEAEFTRVTADVPLPEGVHLVARADEGADAWQVTVDPDGSLCVERRGDRSCSGSSGDSTVTVNSDFDPTLVAGSAPGAATVDVLDGSRSLLVAEPIEVDGNLYFAATAPDGVDLVEVVITDSAGNVDRQSVSTQQSGTVSRGTPTTTGG